jgi:hypothetical protein
LSHHSSLIAHCSIYTVTHAPKTTYAACYGRAMSIRDNFSAEEWEKVLSGTTSGAAAVVAASPSGITGLVAEGTAASKTLRELAQASPSPLIQAIRESLEAPRTEPAQRQRFRSVQEARSAMLERVRQALWLVDTKASPEDAAAYRRYVLGVAEAVAAAATEGGFLGIGGEKVSQAERATLDELRTLLGLGGEVSSS